jgi:hypothetical protein
LKTEDLIDLWLPIRKTVPMHYLISKSLMVVCVLTAVSNDCLCIAAGQIGDSKAIWGLSTGDTFSASVVIVKQTEVTVGEQSPTQSETTDKFQIQYQVVGVDPAGDIVVAARMQRPERETSKSSPQSLQTFDAAIQSLEQFTVVLQVSSEGVVTSVSPSDRESLIAYFSGLDPSSSNLLSNACPNSVVASWFARPFWIAHDQTTLKEGAKWDRTEDIALGSFGTLHCETALKVATVDPKWGSIELKGSGRFVPLVLPTKQASFGEPPLAEFTAELDEYSGKARMFLAPIVDDVVPSPPKRPQFESIELTLRFHGTGTIVDRSAEEQAPPQKVTFRQTQIQSWLLQGFSFGRRELFFNMPTPRR